ncbi:thioredoxin [bacterium]|nr:thioredoxin [bacterium]
MFGIGFADVKHADDSNFEKEVLNSKGVVLVDFWATWCGPCQKQAPVLQQLSKDPSMKNVKIVKVDVDKAKKVSYEAGIKSIPTLMILKDGEIEEQWSGFTDLGTLKGKLSKYCK